MSIWSFTCYHHSPNKYDTLREKCSEIPTTENHIYEYKYTKYQKFKLQRVNRGYYNF